MFHATIFHHGPLTRWLNSDAMPGETIVSAQEVIAQKRFRWRWTATAWAHAWLKQTTNTKCAVTEYDPVRE